MTTQQFPSSLPPGWESDYDVTSERWFFVHRPTSYSQFFFPKEGDEKTRVAELAVPKPTNASLLVKMNPISISGSSDNSVRETSPVNIVQSTAQAVSVQSSMLLASQSPGQGSPLARTVSGSVQRKAIPRRDSVQSWVSTSSSQTASQTARQDPMSPDVLNNQIHITHNAHDVQQVQQYAQALLQGAAACPSPSQYPSAQINCQDQRAQNSQPLSQQPNQLRVSANQAGDGPRVQTSQSHTQNAELPQVQPLRLATAQPVHGLTHSLPSQHPHNIPSNQPSQYQQALASEVLQQPQRNTSQLQYQTITSEHHSRVLSPQQPSQQAAISSQHQPKHVDSDPQHGTATQIQLQHTNPQNQGHISPERRLSTIPISHTNNGQMLSPLPQINQAQTVRHSSIDNNNYQSTPIIQQMHPISGQPGQPIQYVSAQTYVPQNTQAVPTTQTPSSIHCIQQNIAPLPLSLPAPAPGMQWVLVQPGNQQSGSQPSQRAQNSNQSSQYSVQMQQYQGGVQMAGMNSRPGFVARLSSSTMSGSKKAFEASKDFVKKNPAKSIAIVGGLGVVAEACGVSVLTEAVTGSKVYANVQNAKARRKAVMAANQKAPAYNTAPLNQQVQHNSNITLQGHVAGPQHTTSQGTQQQAQRIPQQQSTPANAGLGGQTHQHSTSLPVHQSPQPQVTPSQYQYQTPQGPQQHSLQTLQSNEYSNPYAQSQIPAYQSNGQQAPGQYYQPIDNSQLQSQQPNPSESYTVQQDISGQNSQGSGADLVNNVYNILTSGQQNPPSQNEAPVLFTEPNISYQQNQLPTPAVSPFDASQLQQPSSPSLTKVHLDTSNHTQQPITPATSPFDSSFQSPPQPIIYRNPVLDEPSDQSAIQTQPFITPVTSPFDPLCRNPPHQLVFQDQATVQPSDQSILESQQFTNDLVAQSMISISVQDDNTYVTSSSPAQDFASNVSVQDVVNASVVDDSSYVDATAALSLIDGGGNSDWGDCSDLI